MKEKVSAVYKIVNTVTGDSYIGSSNDVYRRWADHKYPSTRERFPNSQLYKDMKTYGVDKFRFQILCPVMEECLTQVEQELIEMLNPTYNDKNAKGWNVERRKETNMKARKKYQHSEKGKEVNRKYQKKYYNQLCEYNGETLTLNALSARFRRAGIKHPTQEAKKYLI